MKEIFSEIQTTINDFPNQFAWQAEVINLEELPSNPLDIAVCGMGGSALAANVLLSNPKVPNIRIHRDYWHNWLAKMDLIVVSSYSGNTEEMLDVLEQAMINNVPVAVATNGGRLLELANQHGLPHVVLPDAPQPRYAIGYSYVALSALVATPLSKTTGEHLATTCADAKIFTDLAQQVAGKQIVYYATPQNFATAYVWKILTNETAKQMAWVNKIPEFNHNELNGFFTADKFNLSDNLAVVILTSDNEHPRNQKRIDIVASQIADRGIEVVEIKLTGDHLLDRVVYGWQAGMHFSLELARVNDVNPKDVAIIEDLKAQLNN